MRPKDSPPDESFQIRCPKLGHQIHFAYCRQENIGLPCPRTLDCWYMHFHVAEHLRQELSDREWHETFEKPQADKMVSLAELIKKAQNQAKKSS